MERSSPREPTTQFERCDIVASLDASASDWDVAIACADILMFLASIRGGVNGLMAEILEDHIRPHMMTPDQKMESPDELGEDLIGLVRAHLK